MKEILSGMKNMNILEQTVTVKSALKDEQDAQLEALADSYCCIFTVRSCKYIRNKKAGSGIYGFLLFYTWILEK